PRCRITSNPAVRRIGCLGRYSGELQSLAVGPPAVAVEGFEINRAVGNDLVEIFFIRQSGGRKNRILPASAENPGFTGVFVCVIRSEEHTSELQSRGHLVCRLL